VRLRHNVGFIVLMAVALPALAAACSTTQEAEESERVSEAEPTAEKTQEPTQDEAFKKAIAEAPRGHRGDPGDQLKDMQAAQPGGDLTDEEKCQLDKAVADLGRDGAEQLVRDWVLSSIKADSPDANLMEAVEDIGHAQSFSSFLAERGYVC
jgi:hypothetical protein